MTATIRIRIPLRDGVPRPKEYAVPAGLWPLTHRAGSVEVAGQVGRVTGWHDDHPNRHTVLNVEVDRAG